MSKYSKFWPKGGLPGILHHYVSALPMLTCHALGFYPEKTMLDIVIDPIANKHPKM